MDRASLLKQLDGQMRKTDSVLLCVAVQLLIDMIEAQAPARDIERQLVAVSRLHGGPEGCRASHMRRE